MSLPVLRGASSATYPFVLRYEFLTGVSAWQSGAQQRWIRRAGAQVRLELPYAHLSHAQKDVVKAAITSAKGRFDQTLSLTLFGTTVTNLGLDADEWAALENPTTQYTAPLKLTQSIMQNLSPASAGAPFPALANGAPGVLPFAQKKRYQTVSQRVEAGANYTYAEFAGGLAGYPGDGLMAWEFSEERLSDADAATRISHFIANFGRAYSFVFTDPEDSTAYPKTHYASDDLVVTFRGVNDASVRIALESAF